MRGVILAGGRGARLMPLTATTNKHLLMVGDRAMIEYPLRTLRELGADEILVVTNREHVADVATYFAQRGIRDLTFAAQDGARGIAHALAAAEDFARGEPLLVILGDNIFAPGLQVPEIAADRALLWVRSVDEPGRFGILQGSGERMHIAEKPVVPESDRAVLGLYRYPADVFDQIREVLPSARGEYEITDLNNRFLAQNRSAIVELSREHYWQDAGTHDSLEEVRRWAGASPAVDSIS